MARVSPGLRPGGLAYINVGDAMRTIGDEFRLFSSRILQESSRLSFSMLPDILWRTQLSIPHDNDRDGGQILRPAITRAAGEIEGMT